MIDHPYAKKAAKYANIGSDVAKTLGYGKKKHRKHMRGRGGAEDPADLTPESYMQDQNIVREAMAKGMSKQDILKNQPRLSYLF